ncbi:MAG: GNAT family N-acetyltransferase [Hyphomicrobiaceae bacterium]
MTAAATDSAGQGVLIVAYESIGDRQRAEVDNAVERIFFAASSVQSFRDAAHRDAFRWLWLGRYLEEEPDEAFVAIADGAVCGYLVGSLIDPAPRAVFRELDYFQDFAAETARYPAHLHINLDERFRSLGIGGRLIARFDAHATAQGVPGMHVVTGDGMRNVGFYTRLGFREVARAPRNGGVVVMLAKALGGVGTPAAG